MGHRAGATELHLQGSKERCVSIAACPLSMPSGSPGSPLCSLGALHKRQTPRLMGQNKGFKPLTLITSVHILKNAA